MRVSSAYAAAIALATLAGCGTAPQEPMPAPQMPQASSTPACPDATAFVNAASSLADRFKQGDPTLTERDATTLVGFATPATRAAMVKTGCGGLADQFEQIAMGGLQSSAVDVPGLLLQVCTADTARLGDVATEATREQARTLGVEGLKLLGKPTDRCVAPRGVTK
jgi:hypothetical protein